MSFLRKILLSFDETVFITKSTLVGLGRIIEGKLSFNKSVSGPVKMVAIAAKTVELGWQTYFLLMAQITIILGVMNLLPIPVLDGGHIVFYLIEAIYKPVSFKVQATATRIGMALMLALGIYVIGLDIIDVFFRRVFG
jgi:regulator of sigma E protease